MKSITKNVTKKELYFETRLIEKGEDINFVPSINSFVFSIKLDNTIIGTLYGEIQEDYLYVYSIYIDEQEREKGYATDLIIFAEEYIKGIKNANGEQIVKMLAFNLKDEIQENIRSIISKLDAYSLTPNIYLIEIV